MNKNYSARQSKIYSDYNSNSTENLKEMLESGRYFTEINDVIKDILDERNALPDEYKIVKSNQSVETDATSSEQDYANKTEGRKNMLYGGLWFIGGTVVTLVTYSLASDSGGSYVIAWGAIAFGLVQFIKGIIQAG